MDKDLVKAAYVGALGIHKRAAHNENVQALIDAGIIQPGDIETRGWYNPTRWWDWLTNFGNRLGESAAAYLAPFQTGMSPQQYRETLEMSNKNRRYAVQQGMVNRIQRAASQSRDEAKALDYRPNNSAGINSPEMQEKLRRLGYVRQDQAAQSQQAQPAQQPPQPAAQPAQPQQPAQQPAWATAQGMKNWRAKYDAADPAGRQAMLMRLDERGRSMTGAEAKRYQSVANQMRQYARRQGTGSYYDPNAGSRPRSGGSYYNGNQYRMAGGTTVTRPPIPYNPRWH